MVSEGGDRADFSEFVLSSPEIRKAWERNKTMTTNLKEIGLAYDPNKVIKIPNVREQRLKLVRKINGFVEEDNDEADPSAKTQDRPKGFVMEQMEADANALRSSNLRLPKGIVAHLSYMMDQHKLNYKAMTMDLKNYDQWTWKQFRAKIRKFVMIPAQFDRFLDERELEDIRSWREYDTDDEL